MLRGCSIACTLLTISLAFCGGDHLPAEPDDLAAWASIGVISPRLLFCETEVPSRLIVAEANRSFRPPSTRHQRGVMPTIGGSEPCPLVGEGSFAQRSGVRGLFPRIQLFIERSCPRIETPHPSRTASAPPSPTRGEGKMHTKIRQDKKKGAPTCAGAPQRSGHCRVCARTGVLGVTPGEVTPRENSHVVGALRVLGDV